MGWARVTTLMFGAGMAGAASTAEVELHAQVPTLYAPFEKVVF
jgi:hypothetical protein